MGVPASNLPLRVGVIGLGRVAWALEQDPLRHKPCTHVGAWLAQPDVQLIAGCDIDHGKREDFARAHGTRVYADFREMLAQERLDLVSICAYADSRHDMVVAAADAGVLGIWCEKAMATSLAETRAMRRALEHNGTRMIVTFLRRWMPRYRQVRQLLDEGTIGRLQSINVHFTGNMLHTGTHAFDVLRLFAGEVATAQAWLTEGNQNDQSGYVFGDGHGSQDWGGFALLRFDSGVVATVHAEDKAYFRFEFELLGDKGMIRVGNSQEELWLADASTRYSGFAELKQVSFPAYEPANAWRLAAADLIGSVQDGTPVACGFQEGECAQSIALAIHQSHRQGHAPVAPATLNDTLRVASR